MSITTKNWDTGSGQESSSIKYDVFYSGEIAEGLPPFELPPFQTMSHNKSQSFEVMASIYGTSVLSLPFVSFLETISTAKAFCKYTCLQIAKVVTNLFIILSFLLSLNVFVGDLSQQTRVSILIFSICFSFYQINLSQMMFPSSGVRKERFHVHETQQKIGLQPFYSAGPHRLLWFRSVRQVEK